MTNKIWVALSALAAVAVVAACAATSQSPDAGGLDADFATMLKSSFRDQGIAKVDRLKQDLPQEACSSDKPPSPEMAKRIEAVELASIVWPAGGQYFGDWKNGEKLAQSGRGMTWSDQSADTKDNGGQCYNCHQLDKEEISFGTIGPSLHNYGKLRGVKDLNDPKSAPIIQSTWVKLWDSKAYSACSNMPRFGHMKLLDEKQLRDVMALLLDPRSPVNQ
jgi:sulfur-oxidizing protein SoxX